MAEEDVWDDWEDMADSGVIMHSIAYENNLRVSLGLFVTQAYALYL